MSSEYSEEQDVDGLSPADIIDGHGGIEGFIEACASADRQIARVQHVGEYDAKTLIRHAMVALEDQMGLNESWRLFNYQLQDIFLGIRKWEDENIWHKQAVAK